MTSPQSLFFETFGYIKINSNINRDNILDCFENEIISTYNYPKLSDINNCTIDNSNRPNNLRYHGFKNNEILSLFYNNYILDKIYELTEDFIVLSPLESFHLLNSKIHKDNATELKRIKLVYYLDNLDTDDKGPLWVLPGTHHMYDRYNSLIGTNVDWPPTNGIGGSDFIKYKEYFEKNIPKTYLYTNNEIIMFNPNICHGSNGDTRQNILRRCLGMTIICIDRNNTIILDKISNFLNIFNINNTKTNAYVYIKENKLERWEKHFFLPSVTKKEILKDQTEPFQPSDDGTDRQNIIGYDSLNLFRNYKTSLLEAEIGIFNCYSNRLKECNKISDDKDCFGVGV